MIRKTIATAVILWVSLAPVLPADDGVYQTQKAIPPNIDKMIESYVYQVMINTMLTKTRDVFQNVMQHQNVQMFPQIAYEAIQYCTLNSFKQTPIQERVKETFQNTFDIAKKRFEAGESQAVIQQFIERNIKDDFEDMDKEPAYQYVVEVMLSRALMQQQQIIILTALQQQAQLSAIEEQKRLNEQMIQQSIQSLIVK